MEIQSYKNKVLDFGTREGSFKNDQGEQIDYTQVVLVLSINGVEKTITLSGANAPKPADLDLFLTVADEV